MQGSQHYFDSRLKFDSKRRVVWTALWDFYFRKLFTGTSTLVELGAGWCDFINVAAADRRIAIDIWPGVERSAEGSVEAVVTSASDLGFLGDESVDGIFASNLVEHLTQIQFDGLLREANRVLQSRGKLVLMQPNYRLSYRRYFDDFTHVSVWSDVSLSDFLSSRGWEVEKVVSRFLPLTVKSKLPASRILVRLYLLLPFKPFAGQMLVVANPPRVSEQ